MQNRPLVIVGGTLIDGSGSPPIKDSVIVIEDKWIKKIGVRGKTEVPEGAELIEVSGKTVLPGFIDAHSHFINLGIRMIRMIDLSYTKSISEVLEKVKMKVKQAKKGDWILGRGWDESKWLERRFITKEDLDPLSKDNPVYLKRVCGHMITLNSRALEIAKITNETPEPLGGMIDRKENGDPTGVVRDAEHLIVNYIPSETEELALEGLKKACELALSLGCTSVHEAGVDGFHIRVYQKALEKSDLKLRVYLMWDAELLEAIESLGVRTGFGNEMLRLGASKMLIDGSLGARTAALFEPYEDDSSTKGLLLMPEENLVCKVKNVHRKGSQVAVHAIGDYGVEVAINAIEQALKEAPRKNHRHRIEHCELLESGQIERMKQIGILASMQPNFVGEWSGPNGLYEERIGPKRLRQNNPFKLLLDEGVPIAFGSDCMPFNPIYGLWSAVNHPIKSSRISLEEAVKAYTLAAAYASFEEEIKGSVEPGKFADIAILERDITEMSLAEIKDVSVHMTIVNGEILYHKKET